MKSIIGFLASYFFLFLILVIKDFSYLKDTFFISESFEEPRFFLPVVMLLLSLFSIFFFIGSLYKSDYDSTFEISHSRHLRGELVSYSLPYIISFFGFNTEDIAEMLSLAIFLALLFTIQIREKTILLNPIAVLWGYGLYECKNVDGREFIVLARHKPNIGSQIELKEYGNDIFIQRGKNESQ